MLTPTKFMDCRRHHSNPPYSRKWAAALTDSPLLRSLNVFTSSILVVFQINVSVRIGGNQFHKWGNYIISCYKRNYPSQLYNFHSLLFTYQGEIVLASIVLVKFKSSILLCYISRWGSVKWWNWLVIFIVEMGVELIHI